RNSRVRSELEATRKEIEGRALAIASESKRMDAMARALQKERAELLESEKRARATDREIRKARRDLKVRAARLAGQTQALDGQHREYERNSEALERREKESRSQEAAL